MSRLDLLYAGTNIAGNFVSEFADARGLSVDFTGSGLNQVSDIVKEITEKVPRYLIINLSQVNEFAPPADSTAICEELTKLKLLSAETELIIHNTLSPSGSDLENSIRLLSKIEKFINNSSNQGSMKEELEIALSSDENDAAPPDISSKPAKVYSPPENEYYDYDPPDISAPESKPSSPHVPAKKEEQSPVPAANSLEEQRAAFIEAREQSLPSGLRSEAVYGNDTPVSRKISVFGSTHRIGTTTAALQLVRYFLGKGDSACYLERNNTEYIADTKLYIPDDRLDYTPACDKLAFNNIDMFGNPALINNIEQLGYNVVVNDFGAITDEGFDLATALEKDIVIVVCGNKAPELSALENVIDVTEQHTSIFYLFNFAHEKDHDWIKKEMMGDSSHRTFFMKYTPDPFVLENSGIFDSIASFSPVKKAKRKGLRLR
jgi:hypothetical protein